MSKMTRYGTLAAMVAIVSLLLVFSWLTAEVNFPAFQYVSGDLHRQLVPSTPYDDIAGRVSRFLWEHRALDLNSQAFVIVAAVICCLALLKREEVEG